MDAFLYKNGKVQKRRPSTHQVYDDDFTQGEREKMRPGRGKWRTLKLL